MSSLAQLKTIEPSQEFYWGLSPEGFHQLSYLEWGDPRNPKVLICVHGLTRNSRDFDYLARALSKDYRVICPDVVGRGDSDYIGSTLIYNFTQYISDMVALIARIGAKEVNWLGTSMGGIVGMMMASFPKTPIKNLILNDVGMVVPSLAMNRIATYARNDVGFKSLEEARKYFQTIMPNFGIKERSQWDHIARWGTRQDPEGTFKLAYDPAIGQAFLSASSNDIHLETFWHDLKCPVLVIRGQESDLLTPEIVEKMSYLQPQMEVVEIPGAGHAPALMSSEEIEGVSAWLNKT
ncbi:Alpha/beta hydrolase [Candidatus Bealeia paramacronuclearis]|uniref:Alpha/beta hydrolase n=1 Tax=Candidatus Bealeia paramacronuclearis TaxID=1921001 RepID=A0ABZ2C4V1_9PROT|nr:Alpha/beta hydrolase [Candidatus Bealeia paramacronuclearis]